MLKSNLEPIEESDLDLEGKLKNGRVDFSREESSPFATIERETPQEIDAYGKILSKVQTVQSDDEIDQAVIVNDAKTGYEKMDAQSQVQHLIDIAGQKGVVHAVKVAQHMQDNYVLDTFHDRMLGEELHNALVEKGMIKEL